MALKKLSREIKPVTAAKSKVNIASIVWKADGSRALIGTAGGRSVARIAMVSYSPLGGSIITEVEPEYETTMLLVNPSPYFRTSTGGLDAAKKGAQEWLVDYVNKFLA